MANFTRAQLLEQRRAHTLGTTASAKAAEVGVSGTNNWAGRIHAESNAKLQWERAYGSPGATNWGEWEKLHRTDHCVASALSHLAAPIRDATVRIEVPESIRKAAEAEKDTPGEATAELERVQNIADFCQDNFDHWLEPRTPTLLEQIVTYGVGYGFSLHEEVWGTKDDARVPGGVAVYLRKLAQRLPSSIKTDGWKERDGELVEVLQSGVRDGRWLDGIVLPAEKLLLATWARSGNNYQGFSAFRAGWYLAIQRADLVRMMGIIHQRQGVGVPVATCDKDTVMTDEQRDNLQTILENMVYHENAAIQLPPGVTLTWVFSPGATNNAPLETWKAWGTAIYELVQAQQTALGTNETGSRAVGQVHAQARGTFVAGVRSWVESVFNGIGNQPYTGAVRKLVDANFGPQELYPEFKLVLDESEEDSTSQAAWAGAVTTLSNGGALTLTPSDESFVREKMGLPLPEQAELDAARVAKANRPQPAAFGATGKDQLSFSELLGVE
jgi:hypothetical protein